MNKPTYKSPLYVQLRELIRNKIKEGEYPPGTAIPSEKDLSKMYGLNRLSVRNAIQTLVKEGLLKSIQGKGVFVNGPKIMRSLDGINGYRQVIDDECQRMDTRIVIKSKRIAGPYYSRLFNIDENDEIWYVQRVNSIDKCPYSLEEIYIPREMVPNFGELDISLYPIGDACCWEGHVPSESKQTLCILRIDKARGRLMDLEEGQAVMQFSSLTKDVNGIFIEFSRSYIRGDRAEFNINYSN